MLTISHLPQSTAGRAVHRTDIAGMHVHEKDVLTDDDDDDEDVVVHKRALVGDLTSA